MHPSCTYGVRGRHVHAQLDCAANHAAYRPEVEPDALEIVELI